MDINEIDRRLAAGELASVLSKEAWERKLKLVVDNYIECSDDLDELLGKDDECALCKKYFNGFGECGRCPLFGIDDCRDSESVYMKVWDCVTHDELVNAIKLMISHIDKAILIERGL